MAEQMVERMARAIHAVEFEPGDNEAAATMKCPALREFRLAQARAALAATDRAELIALLGELRAVEDNPLWLERIDTALTEGKHETSPPKA